MPMARRVHLSVAQLLVALLAVLSAGVTSGCSSSPSIPVAPSPVTTPVTSGALVPHLVTGPTAEPGQSFTLDLLDSVGTVQVRSADLDGRLFRVQSQPSTGSAPLVRLGAAHTVGISLDQGGATDLIVEVSASQTWTLRFSAGASTVTLDMAAGTLRAVDALAGLSTLDITAGRPSGTVTITETAGLSTLALHLPGPTPVTVHADAGAGSVRLFGQQHDGIGAGSVVHYGDPSSADRYTIEAEGGVSDVVVDG
jgi:hypothetical protein